MTMRPLVSGMAPLCGADDDQRTLPADLMRKRYRSSRETASQDSPWASIWSKYCSSTTASALSNSGSSDFSNRPCAKGSSSSCPGPGTLGFRPDTTRKGTLWSRLPAG